MLNPRCPESLLDAYAMKILTLLIATYLFLSIGVQADPFREDDRLAICGDGSVDPSYSAYIEAYLQICSQHRPEVEDFSGKSTAGSDLLPNLEANLKSFKPTVALTCLGPDGTGDDEAGSAYRERQTQLVDALKKHGVRMIVVGSPLCADPSLYPSGSSRAAAMNKTLSLLADIDKDVAAKEGVVYADVFGASQAAMTKARDLYGDKYAFDTGHFGSPSSIVMAYAYLKAFGYSGDMGSITVDAATGGVGLTREQWFSRQDNTLTIESLLNPFYCFRFGRSDANQSILRCFPFDDELNRYILTVKNLPTARVKITWGAEDHDFSSAELAAGINLPKEFARTPFSDMFDSFTSLAFALQQQERDSNVAALDHPNDTASSTAWDSVARKTLGSLTYLARRTLRHKLSITPLAPVDPWPKGPIPVIVDTDLDSDVDDVGAVALLNSFMDQGEVNLIGCVHDTTNLQLSSCAAIQAINAYYGHPHIPIGQSFGDKGPSVPMTSILKPAPPDGYHKVLGPDSSNYTLELHHRFAPDFPNDDKCPAGVDVYRKALAGAPDASVVICSIGTMENIQDLLLSQPDSVSSLSGLDLVAKKVRMLVIMFNTQPQDHYLLSKWPTKIIWSTYIGNGVGTGPTLLATPENNPVRVAYDLFGVLHNGRQSWDLTAAWIAARGCDDVFDLVPGRPQFLNEITHSPAGPYPNECEATIKMPYSNVAKLIGAQLAAPPKK
jgi:hypothetical protein